MSTTFTSALFISGTLFLNSSEPVLISKQSGDLWISKPSLVEAQLLGGKLLLRAKEKEGGLFIAGIHGNESAPSKVMIVSADTQSALKKCGLKELQVGADSLELKNVRNRSDLIRKAEQLSDCGFESIALSEELSSEFDKDFKIIEAEIQNNGFPLQRVRGEKGLRILGFRHGFKENAPLRKLIGRLRPFYRLENLTKEESPTPGRTLVFDLTLFEFSKRRAESMGLRFPTSIRLQSLDNASVSNIRSGDGSELSIGADFGESQGIGRILARPQVRCLPGEKATFQSGGEIPVKTTHKHGSSIEWKNYGLKVEIEASKNTPIGASEVALSFKVEISDLDPGQSIDGIPGILTRKLESRFELRMNEQSILTSMIQTRSMKNREGIKGLSRTPFLGNLFGTKGLNESENELWFALRPTWEHGS